MDHETGDFGVWRDDVDGLPSGSDVSYRDAYSAAPLTYDETRMLDAAFALAGEALL